MYAVTFRIKVPFHDLEVQLHHGIYIKTRKDL